MTDIDGDNLYPMLFEPLYREIMWGGNQLGPKLGREIVPGAMPVGEAWEIVDRDDAVSVLENGPLAGATLRELLRDCGRRVVGKDYRGGKFPLLVKLIDAGKRLSLQVHPDKDACADFDGAEPKTEMWYIVAAAKNAKIFAGLNHRGTRSGFVDMMATPAIEDMLQVFYSQPGDAFFIPAGTVHAIGAGNLLLEIQQNSDTTFRISDWGRVGPDGQPRTLHVEEALHCINFGNRSTPKVSSPCGKSFNNRKFPIVNNCPFFAVDDLKLIEPWEDCADGRSFQLLSAINRPVTISRPDDPQTTEIPAGRTCLIPASYGNYRIEPLSGEESTVIKTTV